MGTCGVGTKVEIKIEIKIIQYVHMLYHTRNTPTIYSSILPKNTHSVSFQEIQQHEISKCFMWI